MPECAPARYEGEEGEAAGPEGCGGCAGGEPRLLARKEPMKEAPKRNRQDVTGFFFHTKSPGALCSVNTPFFY